MLNLPPIDTSDRRRAERRSALDVNICLVDLGQGRSAMLLDVSETGVGVQTVEGPGEGLYASFKFTLPDTEIVIAGEAEIAWADRAGRMGLRFTNVAEAMRAEIRKWVTSEANPLFSDAPVTDEIADLDARDRVAQLEARIIVSGWAQLQALNFLVDQIAAMTQASGVAIAVEEGGGIVCKASSGIAPQVGVRIDQRSGLSWECVRTREIVQCVDTETDPRVDRIVCRQLNMRSAMLVPVMKKARVAGLVEVFSSRAHAFNNQTVILLRRVAEAVASLDETAPNIAPEEPLIPKPHFAAPVPPPMAGPVAVPSQHTTAQPVSTSVAVAAPAPAPVPPKPAPVVAAPVAAAPFQAVAEPQPVQAPRKTELASTVAPSPTAVAVTPAIIASKPAVAPTPKPIESPRPAVTSEPVVAAAPAPAPRNIEKPRPTIVPAATPVSKAIEAQVETKPAVDKKKTPVTTERPLPAPVQVKKPVEKAPAARVEEKVPTVPPFEMPTTPKQAPRQAVAYSAAAAAQPARVTEIAPRPAPNVEEIPEVEELPSFFSQVEESGTAANKRIGIAAAAVVLVGAMGYGAWYMARPRVVYEASAQPPAAAKTETPANAPAAQPVTPASSAAANTTSAKTAAAASTSPKAPAPAAESTTPDDTTKVAAQRAAKSEPIVVAPNATEVRAREADPAAPPVAFAPPNTMGMASILANPVPTPSFSPQRISQGVSGGKQIRKIQPSYPQAARTMRLTGTVTVRAHVDRSGNVTQVQVVKGHPLLTPAALDAVRRWKYEPFRLNGQAIENDINVDVRFDLPNM